MPAPSPPCLAAPLVALMMTAAPVLALDSPGPPLPRPDQPASVADEGTDEPAPDASEAATPAIPPPLPRPGGVPIGAEGALCGSDAIIGRRLTPIRGSGECGIPAPVRVASVAGVGLEPPAVIACETALALETWLEAAAKPGFAADGAPLAGLGIAASYVCRSVNDAPGGDLSEHARGQAIDIARFEREDGTMVEILDGWDDEETGPLLQEIHAAACGIFGTALGPESDEWHLDHVHYDVAERRRPYCPGGDG